MDITQSLKLFVSRKLLFETKNWFLCLTGSMLCGPGPVAGPATGLPDCTARHVRASSNKGLRVVLPGYRAGAQAASYT